MLILLILWITDHNVDALVNLEGREPEPLMNKVLQGSGLGMTQGHEEKTGLAICVWGILYTLCMDAK